MRVAKTRLYLLTLILLTLPVSILAEDEWPPKGKGFTMAMLFGPEGIGGGLGYVWHDVAGKPGRFLQVYDVFTDTAFRQYILDYVEPSLFLERDKLSALALYVNRTGSQFFGVGPDTDMDDAACYGKEIYLGRLSYTVLLPGRFGISLQGEHHRTELRDTDLDDPGFDERYPDLDRPISEVYPLLYESEEFNDRPSTHALSLALFHDNQAGRNKVFPTKGGYERITATRVNESLGADWNYWRYSAETAHFFPLIGLTSFERDPYNILGLYVRWDRLDGDEIPFWAYPALGHSRISISDYLDEFGLRGYWENRYADQNRALASFELRHRVRANWYPRYKSPENRMAANILSSMRNFVYNTSWVFFYDLGQVWSDEDDELEDLHGSAGVGWVFYFDPGHNMRVTIAYSDELSNYIIFAYKQAF